MASSKKFTYVFSKKLKNSDFLSFGLIISGDESQSKAKFNLQRLGENQDG